MCLHVVPQEVAPDPTHLPLLLGDPKAAIETFFPDEAPINSHTRMPAGCHVPKLAWSNHVYAVHAVVNELHCLALDKPLLPVLVAQGKERGFRQ